MGRKPSNIYQETSIALQKGTEFRLFDVKLPLSCKVTFETTDPNIVKAQSDQAVNIPPTEKDRITKLFEDKGYRVIKIEPLTIQIPGLCPSCSKKGTPKIEKKNAKDERNRNWKFRDEVPRKYKPDEYWLVFVHNSRKKCRISRFLPLPYPSWRKQKDSPFPYTKFMFPYNGEWLESQLLQ